MKIFQQYLKLGADEQRKLFMRIQSYQTKKYTSRLVSFLRDEGYTDTQIARVMGVTKQNLQGNYKAIKS